MVQSRLGGEGWPPVRLAGTGGAKRGRFCAGRPISDGLLVELSRRVELTVCDFAQAVPYLMASRYSHGHSGLNEHPGRAKRRARSGNPLLTWPY